MQAGYKLYGRPGSGSLAVQVALEEVGAPYERIWVGSEPQDLAALRALSPTGKVPVLVLPDGRAMFESGAMLIHLALAHPQAAMAPPPGGSDHAQFLQWIVFLSANVYETVLRIYYSDRYADGADAAAIRERACLALREHLSIICARLDPYVLGARYSLADAYLYMLSSWDPAGTDDLHRDLPRLGAHAKLLGARPAFVRASADHAQ
ncbi:MAG: glutathione S-transferase family protein [Gammaproteobacteria bacterium]|nr:glutathione S-transferase family protein [Gammaproteobacteria bacterium]